MPKSKPLSPEIVVPEQSITDRVHQLRGQKIMLDKDLAEIYMALKPFG